MAQIIVRMKCVTNLHAGSGDVNYNIIDNEVERDPVTGYPTIHSSGIKGALREYFVRNAPEYVNAIFGAQESNNTTPGKLKFLTADMLAIPVRASKGNRAYYLATTQTAMERYSELCKTFLNRETEAKDADCTDVELEGVKPESVIEFRFGKLYLVSKEEFGNFSLPVLARNYLENGLSKNLWYEEVVPHESLFAFPVLANEKDNDLLESFAKQIDGKIVQFGGNASIGYGLCKLEVER